MPVESSPSPVFYPPQSRHHPASREPAYSVGPTFSDNVSTRTGSPQCPGIMQSEPRWVRAARGLPWPAGIWRYLLVPESFPARRRQRAQPRKTQPLGVPSPFRAPIRPTRGMPISDPGPKVLSCRRRRMTTAYSSVSARSIFDGDLALGRRISGSGCLGGPGRDPPAWARRTTEWHRASVPCPEGSQ
jgi:hypothetical protein